MLFGKFQIAFLELSDWKIAIAPLLRNFAVAGVSLALVSCSWGERQWDEKPKSGFVPDSQTAESIAMAVWAPIYGKKDIEEQKPFQSRLKGRTWIVEGTLDLNPYPGAVIVGGTAYIEIDRFSGKIKRVTHGE